MSHKIRIGGHRGMGCTDHDFYQPLRRIADLPVENTLAGIEAAFAAGADYIETDAVMSGDGVLFTLHNVVPKDHFFDSAGPGGLLNTLPFDRIAGFGTGRAFTGRIDRLQDVLARIAQVSPHSLPWDVNVEIKGVQGSGQSYETNDYLERLADTVLRSGLAAERVLFSSFSLQNIMSMSRLLPAARYGMLFAEKPEARAIYADRGDDMAFQYLPFAPDFIGRVFSRWRQGAAPEAALKYLHPEAMTITPAALAACRDSGAGINCWAIFEELTPERRQYYLDLAARCAAQGVPLTIITDYIPEMKNLFEGKSA